MSTLLRPNLVTVDRRSAGSPSQTGARAPITTTLNHNIPALIDLAVSGSEAFEIDGLTFLQDAVMFVDGLQPYQFIGVSPGGTVVVGGVTYTVSANGLGAFPDIGRGDRITDETSQTYLSLAVAVYYDVMASLEIKLAIGKEWA